MFGPVNAYTASEPGRALEDEIEGALRNIPAGRFGRPDEFGAACAFLCSSHAGYLTGQNIVLDGGAFPGML
jgi:3-oxoacyl-[acyl-carrier protein] reductase